uniref:Uncharacterized protein n=1 Tax=Nelumbo nucifera TaxID=4432 RepID=A0A822Z710_NELNU|nr:TPA_asm: hypothetical protein HUJ06_014686 [Nelumbo nucifera]
MHPIKSIILQAMFLCSPGRPCLSLNNDEFNLFVSCDRVGEKTVKQCRFGSDVSGENGQATQAIKELAKLNYPIRHHRRPAAVSASETSGLWRGSWIRTRAEGSRTGQGVGMLKWRGFLGSFWANGGE